MVSVPNHISEAPTAAGLSARLALKRLERLNIDPKPLLRKSRLSAADIAKRNPICAVAQIEFLNQVAIASSDDSIGMSLAESYDLRELGMLYYVAVSSPNLHEALNRLARYSRLGNEGIFGRSKHGDSSTIEFVYAGIQRYRDRQQIEFLALTLVRLCRHMIGRNIAPQAASFVHFRSDEERASYSLFGQDVQFGAMTDEITFDALLFDLPLVGYDPFLNELMSKACEEALAKRKTTIGTFRVSVENAIAPLLPHGEANPKAVGDRLGLSQRTFHRRLAKEGLRFGDILDEMRRDLAEEYLEVDDLQISQIAWLLGFKNPSAFTHSCGRWFGKSPTRYRRELT